MARRISDPALVERRLTRKERKLAERAPLKTELIEQTQAEIEDVQEKQVEEAERKRIEAGTQQIDSKIAEVEASLADDEARYKKEKNPEIKSRIGSRINVKQKVLSELRAGRGKISHFTAQSIIEKAFIQEEKFEAAKVRGEVSAAQRLLSEGKITRKEFTKRTGLLPIEVKRKEVPQKEFVPTIKPAQRALRPTKEPLLMTTKEGVVVVGEEVVGEKVIGKEVTGVKVRVGPYTAFSESQLAKDIALKQQTISEQPRTYLQEIKTRGPVEPTLTRLQKLGEEAKKAEIISKRPLKERGILPPETPLEFYKMFKPVDKKLLQLEIEARAKASGVATGMTPFFVPGVREAFLIGGGAEKFAFKERRQEMQLQSELIQSTAFGKIPGAKFAPQALAIGSIALGAYGASRLLTRPTITPLPKAKEVNVFMEEQKILLQGKVAAGKFVIKQTEPAQLAKVTTPMSKILRRSPKIIQLSKEQTRIIATTEPIFITPRGKILGQPMLAGARKGVKGYDVNRFLQTLRGEQKAISLTKTSKLPRDVQFLMQKAAEAKTGVPVSPKFASKILAKTPTEKRFLEGPIETVRKAKVTIKHPTRVKPGELKITTTPFEKEIRPGKVFTISEEVKTIGIKGGKGVRFETKLSEDVSENLLFSQIFAKTQKGIAAKSIAAGKVIELKGFTKIIPEVPPKTGIVTKGKIVKTIQKPTLTFAQQQAISEAKATAVKAFPKAKPVTPQTIVSRQVMTKQTTKATTTVGVISQTIERQKKVTIKPPKIKPTITAKVVATERPEVKTRVKEISRTKPVVKAIVKPSLKEVTKAITKPAIKTVTKPMLKPVTKVVQKQAIKQAVKAITKVTTKPIKEIITIPKTRIITEPIIKPFILPFPTQERKGIRQLKVGRKLDEQFLMGPGFAERVAGIKPIKITLPEAKKLLKTEFTGFEPIPGVQIVPEIPTLKKKIKKKKLKKKIKKRSKK